MGIIKTEDGDTYKSNAFTFVGQMEKKNERELIEMARDIYDCPSPEINVSSLIDFSNPDEKIWSLILVEEGNKEVKLITTKEYREMRSD